MLLVATRVAPSGIHGNGLFAAAAIARGTPFYRFQPGFDQALGVDVIRSLPGMAQSFLRHFAYHDPASDRWILSGDDARFMNHSDRPNTGVPPGTPPEADGTVTTVALRDIAAGEELTCDYRAFDEDAARKLGGVPADGLKV